MYKAFQVVASGLVVAVSGIVTFIQVLFFTCIFALEWASIRNIVPLCTTVVV